MNMPDKGRDAIIIAIESVYGALKDLDPAARQRVLSSAFTLLGVEPPKAQSSTQTILPVGAAATQAARPAGLVELMKEKGPGTNAQRIAVFAYYRERTEGNPRFGRGDLEAYFQKAKLPPAGNYGRDFAEAVRAGWIHEDGIESYLTTKGIEAIENGFEGERRYTAERKRKSGSKVRKVKRKKK
jgi:hypothetical protein